MSIVQEPVERSPLKAMPLDGVGASTVTTKQHNSTGGAKPPCPRKVSVGRMLLTHRKTKAQPARKFCEGASSMQCC